MPEIIDYKAVLADLKSRRSALDQAIAALEGMLGESATGSFASPDSVGLSAEIHPDTFVGLNIQDATAKYLRMAGRPARPTAVIQESLQRGGLSASQQSVATVLGRVDKGDGEIVRVGRGLWGLAEWYPGRPRRTRRGAEDEGSSGDQKEEVPKGQGWKAKLAKQMEAIESAESPERRVRNFKLKNVAE